MASFPRRTGGSIFRDLRAFTRENSPDRREARPGNLYKNVNIPLNCPYTQLLDCLLEQESNGWASCRLARHNRRDVADRFP